MLLNAPHDTIPLSFILKKSPVRANPVFFIFFRTMTAICFVCNLPIMSHQVGLVWQGGNGWDDLMREQEEESTIRQRLGGRRDSAAQISGASPPSTSPPPGKITVVSLMRELSKTHPFSLAR